MEYKKIGKQLKEVRTRKGLTLEQIYEITRIQPNVLQDIENGESLISPVFLKGFIKTYAAILDVNLKELLTQFKAETSSAEKRKKKKKNKSKLRIKKQLKEKLTRLFKKYKPFILKKSSLSVLFFFVLICLGIQTFNSSNVRENKTLIDINKEDSIKGNKIQIDRNSLDSKNLDSKNLYDKKEKDQRLFNSIKLSEYTKDLFIQVYEPVKIYFKVDRQNTITKNLDAFSIFNIKAKTRIYLRFDKNLKDSSLFYNGNQVALGSNSFFEKNFIE